MFNIYVDNYCIDISDAAYESKKSNIKITKNCYIKTDNISRLSRYRINFDVCYKFYMRITYLSEDVHGLPYFSKYPNPKLYFRMAYLNYKRRFIQ